VGDRHGTVVQVTADDVRLRGLAVRGGGNDATTGDSGVRVVGNRFELRDLVVSDAYIGIDLRQADDGAVEGCVVQGDRSETFGRRGDGIRLWEADRNRIAGNTVRDTRDVVVWYSEGNSFVGNRVTGGRYGIHLMHASWNRIVDNEFADDVVGVFVMYSHDIEVAGNVVARSGGFAGVGLGFKDSDQISVRGNQVFGNTTGMYVDSTPKSIGAWMRIDGNVLAYNHVGLRLHGVRRGLEILGNTFHENPSQVTVDARTGADLVRFEENRWSDYTGYDLDRDGHGDIPHQPRMVSGGLVSRNERLRFFSGTLAMRLLDYLGALFPMFAPQPLLTDPRPVTS
jgi:nitrous oxidase accessory protein